MQNHGIGMMLKKPEKKDKMLNHLPVNTNSLFFYRKSNTIKNFGDELSPYIVEKTAQFHGLGSFKNENRRMLGIGSILHFAKNNDVIWGSGINGKVPLEKLTFDFLDVRIVRGPLTADILKIKGISVPNIFGDPGNLLPLMINPEDFIFQKNEDYVIIPNMNDIKLFRNQKIVNPTWNWMIVLQKILNSSFVISSALHGIILSEAFKIPARVVLLKGHAENTLKYIDYYEGTGRSDVKIAKTVTEALKLGGVPFGKDTTTDLLTTFPKDLFAWRNENGSAL